MDLLFVCTGNTCRSPLAAARAGARGLDAMSAGVDPAAGDGAAPHAVRVAERADLDLTGHTPTAVTAADLAAADRVVAMDPAVARRLRDLFDLEVSDLIVWAIPDPVGGSLSDYQLCLHQIDQSLEALQGHP